MKASYRGHEINVVRERCLGGWTQIYFSIFREADGYECTSGFSDSEDTVRTWVDMLKRRVDNELAEDDPWCESEDS